MGIIALAGVVFVCLVVLAGFGVAYLVFRRIWAAAMIAALAAVSVYWVMTADQYQRNRYINKACDSDHGQIFSRRTNVAAIYVTQLPLPEGNVLTELTARYPTVVSGGDYGTRLVEWRRTPPGTHSGVTERSGQQFSEVPVPPEAKPRYALGWSSPHKTRTGTNRDSVLEIRDMETGELLGKIGMYWDSDPGAYELFVFFLTPHPRCLLTDRITFVEQVLQPSR